MFHMLIGVATQNDVMWHCLNFAYCPTSQLCQIENIIDILLIIKWKQGRLKAIHGTNYGKDIMI